MVARVSCNRFTTKLGPKWWKITAVYTQLTCITDIASVALPMALYKYVYDYDYDRQTDEKAISITECLLRNAP